MKSRIILYIAFVGIMSLSFIAGCSQKDTNEVVVYVSEDQVFSEPILRDFERNTGIRVRAVYDTEETKSTGVMNRLIAEKGNPQADVYWANEPIRAIVLKQKGISAYYVSPNAEGIPNNFKDPQGYWTGFSARARVLIVNAEEEIPHSIFAYTDERWRNKGVVADNGKCIIEPENRQVGMIFQDLALWPHMSNYKNLEFGLKTKKTSKMEMRKRIDEIFEKVQMTQFKNVYPGELSGG